MRIILASQSPRRRELLSYLVDDFEVQAADIDETPRHNESPTEYVLRLAQNKAQKVFESQVDSNAVVIGSDTAVVCDNEILGKPNDLDDSIRILTMLSGRSHSVLTSYCIQSANKTITESVTTEVLFKSINVDEMTRYWQTNEPADKAGSYAIQGIGGKFVKSISGSVSAVIGLPLVEVEYALQEVINER